MKKAAYKIIVLLLVASALRCFGQSNVYSLHVGSVLIYDTNQLSNAIMIPRVSGETTSVAVARAPEVAASNSHLGLVLTLAILLAALTGVLVAFGRRGAKNDHQKC